LLIYSGLQFSPAGAIGSRCHHDHEARKVQKGQGKEFDLKVKVEVKAEADYHLLQILSFKFKVKVTVISSFT